jgi:hypothetical protein
MATLDQLPPEQRAIVELVVQRGRSYDALAEVLQVPAERVRELARDALHELSPRTAVRVDPDWRGRVADYLLGQQSDEDSRATRDYLKQSETARAWALSLLDSLDPLYENGGQPSVPDPGPDDEDEPAAVVAPVEPEPVRERPKRKMDIEAEAEAPKRERERGDGGKTVEERARERERARKRPVDDDDDDEPVRERKPARATAERAERTSGSLSPAAQAALKRRRTIGAAAGLGALLVIVLVILALTGAFDGSSKKSATQAKTGTSTTAAGQQPLQVLGQIPMKAVGKTKAQGLAYIVQQGGKRFLVVQAKVPPLPQNQKVAAYEVWLYNSNGDSRSLGAQYTNAQGVLQGRADLPADFAKFKAVDISRELFADKNAAHSNSSVLRGTFESLQPVPQQQGGASTQPGATTPGASPTP